MGNYSGDLTDLYKELISLDFYNKSKDNAIASYLKFVNKDI